MPTSRFWRRTPARLRRLRRDFATSLPPQYLYEMRGISGERERERGTTSRTTAWTPRIRPSRILTRMFEQFSPCLFAKRSCQVLSIYGDKPQDAVMHSQAVEVGEGYFQLVETIITIPTRSRRQGEAPEEVGVRRDLCPDRDWSGKTGEGVYLL